MDAIEKSRHTTLERVLTAVGIPNVGKKTAKIITNYELRITNAREITLFDAIFSTTEEELLTMKDI